MHDTRADAIKRAPGDRMKLAMMDDDERQYERTRQKPAQRVTSDEVPYNKGIVTVLLRIAVTEPFISLYCLVFAIYFIKNG